MTDTYNAELFAFENQPRQQAVADFESSPDDAIRALELSKATGIPPGAIIEDLEGWDRDTKQKLTGDVVAQSQPLQDYIRKFPYATKISNDDYAALDEASQYYKKLTGPAWRFEKEIGGLSALEGFFKGFAKGFGDQPIGNWMEKDAPGLAQILQPLGWIPGLSAPVAIEGTLRILSGLTQGAIEGAAEGSYTLGINMGMSESSARSLSRDIAGNVERITNQPHGVIQPFRPGKDVVMGNRLKSAGQAETYPEYTDSPLKIVVQKVAEAYSAGKTWIDAGEVPPVGVHPLLDKIIKEQTDLDLKNLKDADAAFEKTNTKQLSPEYIENYLSVHPEMSIGVSPEALIKLYGEKLPEPGDGILGDVPGLPEQLRVAIDTNERLEIPYGHWVARVPKEVKQELYDHIAVRPGQLTKEEWKVKADIEVYHGSPYEFEAFDAGKVGTGEGAASYGWGAAYVAENPEVARTYVPTSPTLKNVKNQNELVATQAFIDANSNVDQAITTLDFNSNQFPKGSAQYREHRAALNLLKNGWRPKQEGNLYRVRVKRNPEEFLDLDEPFSQQAPEVQNIIRRIVNDYPAIKERLESLGDIFGEGSGKSGMEIYSAIGRGATASRWSGIGKVGREADQAASKLLTEYGIAGNKYLDQGSRGGRTKAVIQKELQDLQRRHDEIIAGSDEPYIKEQDIYRIRGESVRLREELKSAPEKETRNYVIFNDTDLEILDRNGQAVRQVREAAKMQVPILPPERKLKLQRTEDQGNAQFHVFEFVDEAGQVRGNLEVGLKQGGKELTIEYVNELGQLRNAFGPSAIRDLLRQLKEEFPEAKELSGFRVSGARDKAGTWETHGKVSIKLDNPDIDLASQMLSGEGLERMEIGGGVAVAYKPREAYTKVEDHLAKKVTELVNKLTGGRAEAIAVPDVELKGKAVSGVYLSREKLRPLIFVSLDARDTQKTGRHEAIHFLRDYGIIRENEWEMLVNTAKSSDWMGKHKIKERYARHNMDEAALLEEAIAEEFAQWATSTDPVRKRYNAAVEGAFQKMAEFFKEILDTLKEAFGHVPKVDELFEMIESGEVGKRRAGRQVPRRQDKNLQGLASEKEPELPGMTRIEDRSPFAGRFSDWLTMKQREAWEKWIRQLNKEDADALNKRVLDQIERERSTEWRRNKEAVKAEVEEDVNRRPDIAADQFFGSGVLYGDKLPSRPKLAKEFLTEEQIKSLPENYVAEGGMHPDDAARLFGYHSGAELVTRLGTLTQTRLAAGMTPLAYKRRITEMQLEAEMQKRYGQTPEEVLREAQDYVLSETQLDFLHEKTHTLAKGAKLQYSMTRAQIMELKEEEFGNRRFKDISAKKFLDDAGRNGAMIDGFLKQDPLKAYQAQQAQYLNGIDGRLALDLEAEAKKLNQNIKKWSGREIKGIEPEYTDFIQQLLTEAGIKTRRTWEEINESIDRNANTTLEAFVNSKSGAYGWNPKVADWIIREGGKPFDEMTVNEFHDFKEALDSLATIGRKEREYLATRDAEDFAIKRAEIISNIETLPLRSKPEQNKLIYEFDSSITRIEEIIKDLDLRKTLGPLWRGIFEGMVDAKHIEYTLQEELNAKLKEIKGGSKHWIARRHDVVPNDFFIDRYTGSPFEMTRTDMFNIMLNFGNSSNRAKFVKGWAKDSNLKPEQLEAKLWDWINKNATKEDWDMAQKIGDIFADWWKLTEDVYHDVSGVVPKKVRLDPIQSQHYGIYKGWYFPIMYDHHYSDINLIKERKGNQDLFGPNHFNSITSNGYTKERTRYTGAIEFQTTIDTLATRMYQIIHDLAYRRAVIQANKFIKDKAIRQAIDTHYGQEYGAQFEPWLRDVANHFNQNEIAMKGLNRMMRWARMNVVVNALGFNMRVFETPDVGSFNPRAAVRYIRNWNESMEIAKKSLELPHTFKNMDRDFRESLEKLMREQKLETFRATAARWAFWPLMRVSQTFRRLTFVDIYKKGIASGLSEEDAVKAADQQVRLRHGSTGIPDLPSIMRGGEAMKSATMFYGFFNSMYNWQRGIKSDVTRGEYMDALNKIYGAVLIPSLMGWLVFNKEKKDDTLTEQWARAGAIELAGTLPFMRDFGSVFFEGIRPTSPYGIIWQAMTSSYDDALKSWKQKKIEKPYQHSINAIGLLTRLPGAQVGRTTEFIMDVRKGTQHPKTIWEWHRGIRDGEINPRKR